MSDTPKGTAAINWAVATDFRAQHDIMAALRAQVDLTSPGSEDRRRWNAAYATAQAAWTTLNIGCPRALGAQIVLDPMADRDAILAEVKRG